MTTIFRHRVQRREKATGSHLANIYEVLEQMARIIVKSLDNLQLTQRADRTVAVDIFHQPFHLLLREKRQLLQLLTTGLVEVNRVGCQLLKEFQGFLPVILLNIFLHQPLPQGLTPVVLSD